MVRHIFWLEIKWQFCQSLYVIFKRFFLENNRLEVIILLFTVQQQTLEKLALITETKDMADPVDLNSIHVSHRMILGHPTRSSLGLNILCMHVTCSLYTILLRFFMV